MMGQGHSIPIHDHDMRSNTISHSIDRRTDGAEASSAQFVSTVSFPLCLFFSVLPLHILFKNFCLGEKSDDGQIVFFALR